MKYTLWGTCFISELFPFDKLLNGYHYSKYSLIINSNMGITWGLLETQNFRPYPQADRVWICIVTRFPDALVCTLKFEKSKSQLYSFLRLNEHMQLIYISIDKKKISVQVIKNALVQITSLHSVRNNILCLILVPKWILQMHASLPTIFSLHKPL